MSKEILEKKESELEKFKEEIRGKKDKELADDLHWKDINVRELTEEDRIIYRKFEEKISLKQLLEDLEDYRKQFLKARIDDSRSNFCAWLANKINIRSMSEQLKEHEKKK